MKNYFENKKSNLEHFLVKITDNIFLIPGSLFVNKLEPKLTVAIHAAVIANSPKKTIFAFRNICKDLFEGGVSDIFVDLSPSCSILNQNVLVMSDYFLMPCNADYYSKMAIKTISMWLPEWHEEQTPNHTVKFLGIIFNEYKKYGKDENSLSNASSSFKESFKKEINSKILGIHEDSNNNNNDNNDNNDDDVMMDEENDFEKFLIDGINYTSFLSIPDMQSLAEINQTRCITCYDLQNVDAKIVLGYSLGNDFNHLLERCKSSYDELYNLFSGYLS
eukprot:TRINITY_DN481_c0_g5_i2.p1 TRINITY_DN481_c0_g5~~TRINITY_DN481_c0_g5_i2.p1  ORF type:complete len:276 (+),score=62.47 TRINITY_DN481_c0_g5_i2:384-1211(+)